MKKDKLEEYIQDNFDSFNDAEPSDEVWSKISGNLESKSSSKIKLLRIVWQSAAAIIIFLTAWYLKDMVDNKQTSQLTVLRKNIQLQHSIIIIKHNDTHRQQEINNYTGTALISKPVIKSQNTDSLPAELIEATQYYTAQINQTHKLIMHFANYNPSIDNQVNVEFARLDTVYTSLRKDLKDNINNTDVLEAMVLNYRMRLEILENILDQLKSTVYNEQK